MADDYLLQAINGALQGVQNVYVPYKQHQLEKQSDEQTNLDYLQRSMPIQENYQKHLLNMQTQKGLELEQAKDTLKGSAFTPLTQKALTLDPNTDYRLSDVKNALDNYYKLKIGKNGKQPEATIGELYPPNAPRPPEFQSGEYDHLTPTQYQKTVTPTVRTNVANQTNQTRAGIADANRGIFPTIKNAIMGRSNTTSVPAVQQQVTDLQNNMQNRNFPTPTGDDYIDLGNGIKAKRIK